MSRIPKLRALVVFLLLVRACPGCAFGPDDSHKKPTAKAVDNDDGGTIAPSKVTPVQPPSPPLLTGQLPAPTGPWEEPPPAFETPLDPPAPASQESAPTQQEQTGIYEYLTSVCGVRLPVSSSYLTLESAIGRSELTMALPAPVAPGISEFAREILISVSRREIFVNGYKVADVVCTDAKGFACTADTPLEQGVLSVKSETGAGRRHPYLILPLLKQLEYFQKARLALLRHLDDKAYSWLLTCDAVSIAADRDVTFGLLAQVMHTAAMADLSRVRLVVTDDTETLSYIPLLSPRSSRDSAMRMALTAEGSTPEMALWPISWLAVSPSEVPEDFKAGPDPTLPGCLPEVDWTLLLSDRTARQELYREWTSHVSLVAATHAAVLGLANTFVAPTQPGEEPKEVVPTDAAGETSGALPKDANAETHPTATDPELLSKTAETFPYLFMLPKEYGLLLRTLAGETARVVRIPRSQPGELYGHLEGSAGHVLALGPHPQVAVKDLVAALDAIRYRCPLYTMSGKCRRWDPFFPWVYLFVIPNGDFASQVERLLTAPAAPGGPTEEGNGHALDARNVPAGPANPAPKTGKPAADGKTTP